MGLFGKIKNILFEDDEEEEMPIYTKEDVVETPRRAEKIEERPVPVVEEPIKTSDNSQFRNVKRDIDLSFDEKDVLGEIPCAVEVLSNNEQNNVISTEIPEKVQEKKSVFPSFDEDEFERLNARINRNENRVKREVKSVAVPVNNINNARRANNNFSSTTTNQVNRYDNVDRYKINTGTLGSGKKPFTPSPVISPVYGILDKNYTKDDIVDKKDGMKREKVIKPIKREEIKVEKKEKSNTRVDIDSVRRKAYGDIEELEKNLYDIEIPELKEEIVEEIPVKKINVEEIIVSPVEENVSIEEQLDSKFEIDDLVEEHINNKDLDEVVERAIETKPKHKPQLLDDLEKTSTLQILDDIEKELNSIKPISNNINFNDSYIKESDSREKTLEDDLFNLIDSMYEEGEEEDND